MKWPDLAICRNLNAVTPLQLLVTIPEAFRSQLVLGSLDNLLYNCNLLTSLIYLPESAVLPYLFSTMALRIFNA